MTAHTIAHVQILKGTVAAELVFVRGKRKKDWLTLLQQIQIWLMMKLFASTANVVTSKSFSKWPTAPENGKRNSMPGFDALTVHTSIVFMRHMFLASAKCKPIIEP